MRETNAKRTKKCSDKTGFDQKTNDRECAPFENFMRLQRTQSIIFATRMARQRKPRSKQDSVRRSPRKKVPAMPSEDETNQAAGTGDAEATQGQEGDEESGDVAKPGADEDNARSSGDKALGDDDEEVGGGGGEQVLTLTHGGNVPAVSFPSDPYVIKEIKEGEEVCPHEHKLRRRQPQGSCWSWRNELAGLTREWTHSTTNARRRK